MIDFCGLGEVMNTGAQGFGGENDAGVDILAFEFCNTVFWGGVIKLDGD